MTKTELSRALQFITPKEKLENPVILGSLGKIWIGRSF
jgi:hypothetical protein